MAKVPGNNMFVFCALTTLALWGCGRQEPAEEGKPASPAHRSDMASRLAGDWRSVKMEGPDIGNFIKEIRYTFGGDGSFVARAFMTDGRVDTKQGTFEIRGNQIVQTTGQTSLNRRFEFRNGMLIIHDPFLDTTVWLERDGDSGPVQQTGS